MTDRRNTVASYRHIRSHNHVPKAKCWRGEKHWKIFHQRASPPLSAFVHIRDLCLRGMWQQLWGGVLCLTYMEIHMCRVMDAARCSNIPPFWTQSGYEKHMLCVQDSGVLFEVG